MDSLIERRLWGDTDIVDKAIKDIQNLSRSGYSLCVRFSGGKDSVVIKRLFELSGVPFTIRFSKTSVDPQEILRYIEKYHKDVWIDHNRTTMFKMIVEKGFPPTRICRYCCSEFKERNTCKTSGSDGKAFTVTGVRRAESKNRNKRNKYETCLADRGVEFFHPIMDWSDEQVWDFIETERIPYCSLYDEGFTRIGCVGCPLASSEHIKREFERWPNFENAYLNTFERMLEGRSFDKWKNKYDVMEWYIYGVQEKYKQLEGQIEMFDGDYFEQHHREDGPFTLEKNIWLLNYKPSPKLL